MGITLMHRVRHLGVTLALFGVGFYAALLPWHTVASDSHRPDRSRASQSRRHAMRPRQTARSQRPQTQPLPNTHRPTDPASPLCSLPWRTQASLPSCRPEPGPGGVVAGIAQDNLIHRSCLPRRAAGPLTSLPELKALIRLAHSG